MISKCVKKIKNNFRKNKRGFTLIELLVTIGIISIIFSISLFIVYNILINSKKTGDDLTLDNIKNSTIFYVKEYTNEISWNEENQTCVSIKTLISKGYFKEDILNKDNIPLSIIITRDENNVIVSQREEYRDCNTYSKTVEIPTSYDICNNFTYDGSNHFLINQSVDMNDYSKVEYKNTSYKNTSDVSSHPKNAGEYKVVINLANGKQWTDNTINSKTVTCKINKATPIIQLSSLGNSDEQKELGTREVTLKSNVSGKLSVKSSDNAYASAKVQGDKNVVAGVNKVIEITTHATRNSTNLITITIEPTGDYKTNYNNTSITYTVGKVNNIRIDKPTSSLCYDLTYDGNNKTLAQTNEAYELLNNSAIEIGTYKVTARLKYGYIWDDGTLDNVDINCQIKTPTPVVTYKDAVCSPSTIDVMYNKKYGEKGSLCVPVKTGYTFDGWYSDNNYSTKITDDTVVTNFKNHNLYAKWNPNTYIVTFEANGGLTPILSKDVIYNSTYGDLPKPTYTGYTFNGWYTSIDGGIEITSNSIVSITANQTLYASWTRSCTYDINYEWKYDYNGKIQEFAVPCSGMYKLEVWGAQGGTINGGKGGYSYGNVLLNENDMLYVVVGNQPDYTIGNGGYNGGGAGGSSEFRRGGGGGATHIGKTSTLLKNTSVSNLYIVAGGGGGGTYLAGDSNTSAQGGSGGGTKGGTGGNSGTCVGTGADCFERFATGGSQTSGGIGGIGRDLDLNVYTGNNGSYGKGADGNRWMPGGGGGYYGGGAAGVSAYYTSGGGGGSGYIDGVTGGNTQSGKRSGNGYARITLISLN